jgi:Recombinase
MYRQVKGPSGSKFLGGPSLVGGLLLASLDRPGAAPADPDLDIFLTPSRASKSGHDGPMERVRGGTSPSRRGLHGALAGKRAADSRAGALVSIIREVMAAGFVSRRSLAGELNRRGIPTARGGRWHYTTVVRMLTRLGLKTHGNPMINNGQALKRAADARAKALAPTIRALQGRGLVSFSAIARELNERGIPAARGGKWHLPSVTRLLHRVERLEPSSHTAPAE